MNNKNNKNEEEEALIIKYIEEIKNNKKTLKIKIKFNYFKFL